MIARGPRLAAFECDGSLRCDCCYEAVARSALLADELAALVGRGRGVPHSCNN